MLIAVAMLGRLVQLTGEAQDRGCMSHADGARKCRMRGRGVACPMRRAKTDVEAF